MGMLAGNRWRSAGSARVNASEQLANRGFIGLSSACAEHAAHLIPVLIVEKRCGKRAIPLRPDCLSKPRLVSAFLAVIRKDGFVSRDKAPHQNQIAFIVEIDTHDLQSLRPVLLGKLVEHGIFMSARLAPSGPERH